MEKIDLEDRARACHCDTCRRAVDNMRADAKENVGSRTLDKSLADEPDAAKKLIADFQEKSAVEVVRNGKNYDYRLSVNGVDRVLFSTEGSAKGLDAAEKQLAKLVQDKQNELTKTFKVDFSKAGDDVCKQWIQKPDCSWEQGPMVKARAPLLVELYGIEAALYRADPSHLNKAGTQGLKFHFLEDNYYKDQPVLAYYIYADKDKRPSVYFEPGANNRKPATEADADRLVRHQLFSIEALTLHEINHHHQANMGWYDAKTEEARGKEIGWLPFQDTKTNERKYMLIGKNGEFYRRGKDHCKDTEVWVACNNKGEPLDANGKPAASFKAAKQFTGTEIAARAQVKPLTYYFPNPKEMFAEGLMLFRLNSSRRANLLAESPQLYEAVKKQDEEESKTYYGVKADGSPKYIRGVEGGLVENNEKNRKAVLELEEKARKQKPTSSLLPSPRVLVYA